MKLTVLFLLPMSALAFAPIAPKASTSLALFNAVDDVCDTVTSTTEDVLQKADNLALSRVMRFADHAPVIFTLKSLADTAGMSISRAGVQAAPKAFAGLSTALPVATWAFNVYAIAAVLQLASVAKSSLADGSNELGQSTITATAVTNWLVTRSMGVGGGAQLLLHTALVAVASGHSLRNNTNSGGAVTLHNAALQLISSFTTVLTILGGISCLASKVSFVNADVTSVLGLAAFYVLSSRGGNGTVRKTINAGIIGGVVYTRLAAGMKLSFTAASVVGGAITAGAAVLAYLSAERLVKAVMD